MAPVFMLVMGVSGSGKSTLGKALAKEMDMPFYDADDLHPKSNVEKMSRGEPLSDADREPWLELVRTTAECATSEQEAHSPRKEPKGVVVACSALKRRYRDVLRGSHRPPDTSPTHLDHPRQSLTTRIVFISGSRELLLERMTSRKGHFMKTNMLDSQLQTLENPEGERDVITVPLEDSTEQQVRSVMGQITSFLGVGTEYLDRRHDSI